MNKILSISILIIFGIIISSCSKQSLIERRLVGTWQVDVYQKTVYGDGDPVLSESGSFNMVGTFIFESDGKGMYNILKNLGEGTYTGDAEFIWTNTESTLSIRTNTGTNVFTFVKNDKDEMIFEREVKSFYFPENDHEVYYEMIERITLVK